jgi:DNA-binding response OmpR family regulator
MKILIAEDDAILRWVLEEKLAEWGHQASSAGDGKSAWERVSRERFDVVVSDWAMPSVDGVELCRRVRQLRQRAYTYFILLTGRSGRENFLQGMEAGADDYLTKPFDEAELRVRLNTAQRILDMQKRLSRLEGLLPICSYCKRVRDERQYWEEVESYVAERSAAEFSHTICPHCFDSRVRPALDELRRERASH